MADDITKSLAAKYKIQVQTQIDPKDVILIVEDQTDLRLIVSHQIQKQNIGVVRQATNGYEAIEVIKNLDGLKIAAVICDMDMPVMNGLDFLAELRENPALDRGPFCLTMESVSKEKIMLAVENGCDELLVKPFTLADIVPKLRSAFTKYHNAANPEKLYELAKQHFRAERFDEAEKIYKELGSGVKGAARPVVGLARIELKRKRPAEALKLLEEAERRNPHYVHVFHERAMILSAQNDWSKATTAFRKAIDLSPLNALRYKAAAEVLFGVKRFKEAIEVLEIAVKHKLDFPDLHHYLSQAKLALKDYKGAAKHIRSALSADPENVPYLNQLGICMKETGEHEEAMKAYNQAIKNDPQNVDALYNKAVLVASKGDNVEAVKLLERALRKKPDFKEGKAKLEEYRQVLAVAAEAAAAAPKAAG